MVKKIIWKEIDRSKEITAHIAYYYSDQKADLPVRGVRKNRDNKADPNIETKTYGLFTTCMPPARRNIVNNGNWYIFFFTNRGKQRIFTGYYELDKYLVTGIKPRNKKYSYSFNDYALLAKKTHFVKIGVPLLGNVWDVIPNNAVTTNGVNGYGPRDFKSINSEFAKQLKKKLDQQDDISSKYIEEIHKMEKENQKKSQGKFMYPSWERKNGFTTNDFEGFLK